jgi:hypothetical protein
MMARGAVAAGPRLVDGEGRPEISFGRMLTPWRELQQRRLVRAAQHAAPGSPAADLVRRYLWSERVVDWITGACLLLKLDAAAEVGFFDERYFMYEEDVDLCAALRARGGTILFTPAAEVVHLRGRSRVHPGPEGPGLQVSGGPGLQRHLHYDRSHVAFYEKHAPHWAGLLRLWLRLRGRPVR